MIELSFMDTTAEPVDVSCSRKVKVHLGSIAALAGRRWPLRVLEHGMKNDQSQPVEPTDPVEPVEPVESTELSQEDKDAAFLKSITDTEAEADSDLIAAQKQVEELRHQVEILSDAYRRANAALAGKSPKGNVTQSSGLKLSAEEALKQMLGSRYKEIR